MSDRSRPVIDLAFGAAGTAATGAVLGIASDPSFALPLAASVTAVVFGVCAITIPALYIGSSLVGVAPSADGTLFAARRALRSCGVLLLGLAPASLFLLATASPGSAAPRAGIVALLFATAGFAAVRSMRAGLLAGLLTCPHCEAALPSGILTTARRCESCNSAVVPGIGAFLRFNLVVGAWAFVTLALAAGLFSAVSS